MVSSLTYWAMLSYDFSNEVRCGQVANRAAGNRCRWQEKRVGCWGDQGGRDSGLLSSKVSVAQDIKGGWRRERVSLATIHYGTAVQPPEAVRYTSGLSEENEDTVWKQCTGTQGPARVKIARPLERVVKAHSCSHDIHA